MAKRKLLYLGNKASSFGGTATTMESLAHNLKEEGYDVYSASAKRNKLLRLADMLRLVLQHARTASLVLIDTYSTQNFYYAVAVANLCRLLRIPYIPILHGGNLPQRLKSSPLLSNKLFNGAKCNVAPSAYLKQRFEENGYSNIRCIPNAIETDKYQFKQRSAIKPNLLWVRSFSEIYNPKLALKLVEVLNKEGYQASLCMVGPEKDGSLAECRRIAQERNLSVRFTGLLSKEEWKELAANYDIFINTTNYDNSPVSVIEAMALGLPVVSTNVGGIPYLLSNRVDSLVVKADDAEAMSAAVKTLLNDSNMVVEISKNARKKAEESDWQQLKHKWIELVECE